jgi:hypothetical protein
MSRCISCGNDSVDGTALCPHHACGEADWGRFNRAFCDLLHRGIDPLPGLWPEDPWVDLTPEAQETAA